MEGSNRVGGIAGLLFVIGVAVQNGVLLAGNPLPGAPIAEVEAFYVDRAVPISVAVGWVAVNVPLLFAFGGAVTGALERGGAVLWARIASSGIVLLAAAFASTTWLQAVLAARAADLALAGQLGLVWDCHTAAFAMSAIALAVTEGAMSIGALATGVVPRWTSIVGMAGSACLAAAGALVVPTVPGGPWIFLQLAGFATWIVWLVTASVRLLRS